MIRHAVACVMLGTALTCVGVPPAGGASQDAPQPSRVEIPPTTTVIEGTPAVRIDLADGQTTRRLLDENEAAKSRLRISVVDGQYYWTSRENRQLRLDLSGPYTYLSSEPGQYVRFTRVNNRITYVEHVDMALGSVTWWGELRIR